MIGCAIHRNMRMNGKVCISKNKWLSIDLNWCVCVYKCEHVNARLSRVFESKMRHSHRTRSRCIICIWMYLCYLIIIWHVQIIYVLRIHTCKSENLHESPVQLPDITRHSHKYQNKYIHRKMCTNLSHCIWMICIEINAADLAQILSCYLKRDPIESMCNVEQNTLEYDEEEKNPMKLTQWIIWWAMRLKHDLIVQNIYKPSSNTTQQATTKHNFYHKLIGWKTNTFGCLNFWNFISFVCILISYITLMSHRKFTLNSQQIRKYREIVYDVWNLV